MKHHETMSGEKKGSQYISFMMMFREIHQKSYILLTSP
jgi:hypothetical protein